MTKEQRLARIKKLKEINAPETIIKHEEMLSKMTLKEYKIYRQEQVNEERKIQADYAKNYPIQKTIVDEIYNRESKLEYDLNLYTSSVMFTMKIDPLSFMSYDDWENNLYEPILQHAHQIYIDRFKQDNDDL